jgi:hypothetical protein
MQRAPITFGLREAIVLALAAIAIAAFVAVTSS